MSEAKKLDNLFEAVEIARKLERQAIAKIVRDKIMKTGSPELSWIRLNNMIDIMLRGERPE